MRVLGIETSCDETAAAVVDAEGVIYSDVVASQIAEHAPYGGVVPELAARAHLRAIVPVVEQALASVEGGLRGIDAIAVTHGPGWRPFRSRRKGRESRESLQPMLLGADPQSMRILHVHSIVPQSAGSLFF